MRPSAAHPHAHAIAHNLEAAVEIICLFG